MELNMDSFLHQYGGCFIHPRELETMFFGEWDRQVRVATQSGNKEALTHLDNELKRTIEAAERSCHGK